MTSSAKLLGVPTASIKRRIKNKKLAAHKRGKRGHELVAPQHALSLEIMSLIPSSSQLNLWELETIVIKRFEAMEEGQDRRVLLALWSCAKSLCSLGLK